ncbi:MAG: hypothetical protein E7587_05315 [Ruminococcaceae bacterium]|nr:hypothetical protein [Oscillospiraceae bacterium]
MKTKQRSGFLRIVLVAFIFLAIFLFLTREKEDYIPEWENNLSLEELIKLHSTEKAPDGYVSLGKFMLTAYCPCVKCCGKWALNRPSDENGLIVITASGERAKQGVTVAADSDLLSFGTSLQIEGNNYSVQDRGSAIKKKHLDVYFESHEEALEFGVQYKTVYMKKQK